MIKGKWVKKEDLPKPPENGQEYYNQQISKMNNH